MEKIQAWCSFQFRSCKLFSEYNFKAHATDPWRQLWSYVTFCLDYEVRTNDFRYFGHTAAYSSFVSFAPLKIPGRHLELTFDFALASTALPAVSNDSVILMLIGQPELVTHNADYLLIALQGDVPVLIYNLGGGQC